jgi:hypothetical protein
MNSFGMQATVTEHARAFKAIEERRMHQSTKSREEHEEPRTRKSLVIGSNAFPTHYRTAVLR